MKAVSPARAAALEVLGRVERGHVFAQVALNQVLRASPGLNPADRALATELVYGVLRHHQRLDRAVDACASRGLGRAHPLVRRSLRLAAFQILMLDRTPDSAAVDEAVSAVGAVAHGRATGFVNAVLRRLVREGEAPLPDPAAAPGDHLVEACSLPRWLADRLLAQLGAREAVALAEAFLERAPVTVRANRLRITRDRLAANLEADVAGAHCTPTEHAPDGLRVTGLADPVRTEAHQRGDLFVQDEASQLVAHLVAPRPGERLLDACAGRGGKALHLLALADNQVDLLAVDRDAARLEMASARAQRAGLELHTRQADLTAPPEALQRDGTWPRVLLDAPCTGLGVLRRHPETKWRLGPENVVEMTRLQTALLGGVAPLVQPGGLLVYAVCSILEDEGPDVIRDFLESHSEFTPEPPPTGGPVDWAPFVTDDGAVRTLPHHHGGDGFYMIRLRRRSTP